jgi:hypothetical protein
VLRTFSEKLAPMVQSTFLRLWDLAKKQRNRIHDQFATFVTVTDPFISGGNQYNTTFGRFEITTT